jgi:multimeric flavodoxin WrbA
MAQADGIIPGSPTYFADISASMKALIERSGMTNLANHFFLIRHKYGMAAAKDRQCPVNNPNGEK